MSTPAVVAVYGTAYNLNASLSGNQGAPPTGTVTFSIGGVALCAPIPIPSTEAVTCAPSPTLENVGSYTVNVDYSGDSNYSASSSTIALTIIPAPVTITVDSFTRAINTPNPTFTGTVLGAVYRPVEETVPHDAPVQPLPVTLQVTPVFVDPVTVAVNC